MFLPANRSEPFAWSGLDIRDYTAALDLSSSVAWIDVPQGVSFEYENAASEKARLVLVHTPMFDADAEVLE